MRSTMGSRDTIQNYYTISDKIDEGAFGCVYKATSKITGERVAIKHMKNQFINLSEAQNLTEIRFLRALNHDNIIRIKDVKHIANDLYIVYEFASTDLLKFYTYYKNQASLLEGAAFGDNDTKHHRSNRAGTQVPARAGHHPPRHQAREHSAHGGRAGEDRRFRLCEI